MKTALQVIGGLALIGGITGLIFPHRNKTRKKNFDARCLEMGGRIEESGVQCIHQKN